jgi:hypothetical protein
MDQSGRCEFQAFSSKGQFKAPEKLHPDHYPSRTYVHYPHQAKTELLHNYFSEHLGQPTPRDCTINWAAMHIQHHDLGDLDRDITEAEVHAAIRDTPSEKSTGPDGFIGAFYKRCWEIIRVDLTAAIREIFNLRAACWNLLNSANVVLIPKREGAQEIKDYRLISVMHSTVKLLCKILANCLAQHLDKIVSRNQSAFIRGRSIHDNFQYIQGVVNHYHHAKTPMLLIKLDIVKAFDCVWWEYLLELMEQIRFGQ